MASDSVDRISVDQEQVIIPDLTIKDLLSAIPTHCFKRSGWRSSLYVVADFAALAAIYKTTTFLDACIHPDFIQFPYPILYGAAKFALWSVYTFWAGLIATGVWVIAHECGHQAFSESKLVNNTVGWVLHSGLGVPYHSWRITHGKHHASTGHLTQDQVFVPNTRSFLGLPPFDPAHEDLQGASISKKVMDELWEALGDSPIGACLGSASYLLGGWPAYIIFNSSGQNRYAFGTNHFSPSAPMFSPSQWGQIIISDIGVLLWLAALYYSVNRFGIFEVFRTYFLPYLWVNHWLVLITFLQHTDPLLPHYRAGEFTFPRGALATYDRNLLGDLGSVMAWIAATCTHGISETHVAHHVHSKIPHYHAWEASDALRARLARAGLKLQGGNSGWAEVYRVYKQCKFVEDEGDIVFYKNAHGHAAARPLVIDANASDSGIDLHEKDN